MKPTDENLHKLHDLIKEAYSPDKTDKMKNIPKVIYLQVDPENEGGDFNELQKESLNGITWSVDKINKNDVEYFSAAYVKQRYDWVVRIADEYRKRIEEFPDSKAKEIWCYRMDGLNKAAKQFQNLFIKEE